MKKHLKVLFLFIFCILLTSCLYSQARKKPARIAKNSNLGEIQKLDILNTKYLETNISITPNGKYLYFETNRPSPWSTQNYSRGKYDADIWYSSFENGKWQEPKNAGRIINTAQSESEPNISPDGQTMYFQSWRNNWQETGGPYYKSELKGNSWVNPVGLGGNITQFFKEVENDKNRSTRKSIGTDGSTFSPDGKTFIFAFGLDYYGNMDLYMSKKNKKGEWSTPKPLSINTDYNDRCPFLAADGKTLYFASDGYDGFGKMDIFKTVLNADGTCGEVINIGEPFNTKANDYGFMITGSGNDIYFIRDEDIYHMDITNAVMEIKPAQTVALNGIVRDSITNGFLEANVKVREYDSKKEIGSSRSNSITGDYSIVLDRGKKYRISVKKRGYRSFAGEIQIKNDHFQMEYNIILNPDINNISDTLDQESEVVPETATKEVVTKEEVYLCNSKLYDRSYSVGIIPVFPIALGAKAETHFSNFGASILGMALLGVGKYDDPKVPDDLNGDNYTTIFLASFNYNYPLFRCNFYPNIGVFVGVRTRNWKKSLDATNNIISSGSYSDYPFGLSLGGKYFISDRFYVDLTVGFGKLAQHYIPSGDISKYEFKYIPWLAVCYMFE
jgi:hypothetical protein